tara:strand:+ start:4657 stop:5655 length:999 start_codon:yes stop_codon:yes gene_type:complete
MLIDSFLFFQELDLLEIRLKYLYPFVDHFIIIEAKQSFKGAPKKFIFEQNRARYKKYLDKIIYHKIEDIHFSYEGLIKFLEESNSKTRKNVCKFIKKHDYYDKNNLSFILDTYHRECIHIALEKKCKDEDIILLSDLDEIPSYRILEKLKKEKKLNFSTVFIQNEFQYFLNNFAKSDWHGTIASPYKLIKKYSLNELRNNSNKLPKIFNSGYHFTSIGNKKAIINKIESWGHQEFNNDIIKDNLEENIKNGKDIFYRFKKNKNKLISIEKSEIIDERMTKILLNFDKLILKDFKYNIFFNIKYFYNQILFLTQRIINNPKKFLKKIFYFLKF